MKMVIFDNYYQRYLNRFYAARTQPATYAQVMEALLNECFGTSDFYSRNMRALGVDAHDFIINDFSLQTLWARERGAGPPSLARKALGRVFPTLRPRAFLEHCVLMQIREAKPDVAYLQDTGFLSPDSLREIKTMGVLLVGQIACPLPDVAKVREFDLVVSSFPHFVSNLRSGGQDAEYLRIAFEPRVLDRIGQPERTIDAAFVGGLNGHHRAGVRLLEEAARHVPIDVWGYGAEALDDLSPLKSRYHGEAWALDMYGVLARSRIAINRHIDVAENFANNMRLYEATGMGALLLTDAKDNLHELFVEGGEIAVYRGPEDLAEKLLYYQQHESEARTIANAGQARTLTEHTYANRMVELKNILLRYLKKRAA